MKTMLAFPLLLLAACATISHGSNETIEVDSRPSGAAAAITCNRGVHVTGVTPARLVIPRKAENCVVEVSQGDRKKSVAVDRGTSGKYWMNFAGAVGYGVVATYAFGHNDAGSRTFLTAVGIGLGGGLGFVVDAVNGSMHDHNPHDVTIDLEH